MDLPSIVVISVGLLQLLIVLLVVRCLVETTGTGAAGCA